MMMVIWMAEYEGVGGRAREAVCVCVCGVRAWSRGGVRACVRMH